MAKQRGLEVTFMRGNPMPWPAALGCTVGGAICMVLGYTVVPSFDPPGGDVLTYVIAAVVMVPIVGVALLVLFADRGAADAADDVDVPDELDAPPSDDDPALVAVVVGEGQPSSRAIAGTILDLAMHDAVDVSEHGDRVVLSLRSGARPRARPNDSCWRTCEAGPTRRATSSGRPSGRARRRSGVRIGSTRGPARSRRSSSSHGSRSSRSRWCSWSCSARSPSSPSGASSCSSVRSSWRTGSPTSSRAPAATGSPRRVASNVAGGSRSVGTCSARGACATSDRRRIAIWGPNLVYGVLVGQADRVAAVLSPEVGRGDDLVVGEVIRKKTL